ncbi:MAG TPA: hydantoinase B/oxoprolinase family protein [Chloroflexota bacterium]|nr:hydantoinase B/oxoprolinase family protein [Chloroflexota bacterium]
MSAVSIYSSASPAGVELDPITLEVVRNGLISTAREMGLTLLRTSYSPVLNEGKDFSTAIFDSEGQMVAQMEGCPIHMATMGFAVKAIHDRFPREEIGANDMFILNDPYRGGMQLQDITLIAPVEYEGRIAVFLGVRAHHTDAGGMAAGSFPGNATEQYQEGLVIPPMKVVEDGRERTDLLEFILSNVRSRDFSAGDLQASMAALHVGRRGVDRLVQRYGVDALERAMRETLDYSERLVRAGLSRLRDGVYEFEDFVDNDGISDDPLRIRVQIKIEGDEMSVDFTGSGDQVQGPLNATLALTTSAVGIGLLMTCDPTIPVNDGCLRPLTISVPEGSLLNARHPAATCGGSIETTTRVIDCIIGAMSEAVPERVAAGEFGTCNYTMISGVYPGSSSRFYMCLTPAGGWGGTAEHDGWTCTDEPVGNCRNQPVEYLERKFPVLVEEYALDADTAGPGRHRGGFGHILRFILLTDQVLNTMGSRSKFPPFGLFGGLPGGTSAFILIDKDRVRRLRSKSVNLSVSEGSKIVVNTGGGGGYGDPFERPPGEVQSDVANGFLTREQARMFYGVELKPDLSVDLPATEALRGAERPTASPDGGTRAREWLTEHAHRISLPEPAAAAVRASWERGVGQAA